MKSINQRSNFRIGGMIECLFVSVFLSLFYVTLAVFANLPLIPDNASEVFATFIVGITISFVGISALEVFWFERDLDWNGRRRKSR